MASRPDDFMDMDTAVTRLAVNQRNPEGDDVPEDEEKPEETKELDDAELLLGAGDNTVEIEFEGRKIRVERSQLPTQVQPAPQQSTPPAAPQAVDTSHITKLDETIQQLQTHMASVSGAKMPPATLINEDPEAYNNQMAVYNENRARQDQAKTDLDKAMQDRQTAATQAQNQIIANEQRALGDRWPEWADTRTRPRVATQLRDYAIKQGYAPNEADMIAQGAADHRMVLSMRDALRAEILSKKPNPSRKKDRKAPIVGKPGPAQTDVRKRSGKRNDFLRQASRDGTSIRGAADFLAGRYS